MPTKQVNIGIYAGPLQDAFVSMSSIITSGVTPARDVTDNGLPLEMELVVRLDPEPGFAASTVTVVIEGTDVGVPKPTFVPIEGTSFSFGAAGGERRATVSGAALRKHLRARWRADRALGMQRRDLLTVTGVAVVETIGG